MFKGKAFPCPASFLLFALFFLLQQYYSDSANRNCFPSSCGKISSIRHPFRLPDDPKGCGYKSYELTCQNNVAVLQPFPGLYYHVQAINYNNFTIRLVDPGIQESNCSSFPLYSLYQGNFSDLRDPYAYYERERAPHDATQLYEATQRRSDGGRTMMFLSIIYWNCTNPVTDDNYYIDTGPCINENSSGHIYAHAGDFLVGSVKTECHVKQFAFSSLWGAYDVMKTPTEKNLSYREIHMGLVYGFEISWMSRACLDHCPARDCWPRDDSGLQCYEDIIWCYFTSRPKENCKRLWGKLIGLVFGFIAGIIKGLLTLIDTEVYHATSVEDVGIVIGRYLVPYMGIKFLLGSLFLVVLMIYKCRRRHFSGYENIEVFLQLNNINPIRYSYRDIKSMTGGFKDKLGEGGFASVYKGRLRSGLFVAIKMLGKAKTNGQDFISEVATIGRIYHVNVVQLIGFCVEGSKRALVYEFMANGSLDKYIFSKEGTFPLSYEKIYEIALGVARAVAYLHEGCDMHILHFDIKPHNILLDENFIPKVSDFGLAKLYPVENSIVTMTTARGTIGYMAPELFYKNIGGISHKADVYSFGMLLMEMTSKRKNLNLHVEHSSQLYFPFWIYDQFNENKDIDIEDVIEEEKNVLKKMFIVALWCIQLKPFDRPSMSKVIEMLEGELGNLEMPPRPSLYPHEAIGSKDLETNQATTNASSSSITHP